MGRGACDMKGFLALAANLAAEARPERWRAPLALVFTYDEEVGTLGAKRLTESFPAAARAAARARSSASPPRCGWRARTRGMSSCG